MIARSNVAAAVLCALFAVPAAATTHDVSINNFSFTPANLTIAPGDTVKWTWNGGSHSTTSDTGVWDSGVFSDPGHTFSFVFPNAGSFPYHCSIHTAMMTGVITVSAPKVGTTTGVSSSSNPSVYGQDATLTATVTRQSGSGTPTGTVDFLDGLNTLCNDVALSGGTAGCSTASLTVGSHSITAVYGGDANFDGSTSPAFPQTVNKASTTTALVSSGSPSTPGQKVTFTATVTVSPPGSAAPGGTVTILDGASELCSSLAVTSGQAACTTAALIVGDHSLTATYSGDALLNTSTSPALPHRVEDAAGAPTSFSATATSTSQVQLNWGAVSGATGYEVERSALNGPYNLAQTTNGATTAAVDGGLSANTTYLYRVRAVVPAGPTAYSRVDPATTIVFTDANLAGIVIQAIHVTELRTAANAMRAATGLTAATFSDPVLIGSDVKAAHITELRNALGAARAAIGLPLVFTDVPLNAGSTVVKALHTGELRAGTQ